MKKYEITEVYNEKTVITDTDSFDKEHAQNKVIEEVDELTKARWAGQL